jgi:16S rRNA (adenine1518-N6/adenine1519-N6)-dimethyltransferase
MVNKQEFLTYLDKYGIEAKKGLGQNFLYDEALIERVLEEALDLPLDNVLEIGSGAGSLSRVLAKHAQKLVSIEKDESLGQLLQDLGSACPNASFILTDATQLDLSFLFTDDEKDSLHIVANLPYYLTSELISQLILELPQAQAMLFLVQKDAVPRLSGVEGDGKSKSKNQGWISKWISCYGTLKPLQTVGRDKFYPEPNISSQFILLEPDMNFKRRNFLMRHGDLLLHTIKLSFGQRRKSLVNCLDQVGLKDRALLWLQETGKSPTERAENLDSDDFISLTKFLFL